MYFLYYSFASTTETKCGRIVKTPGKFSTCISGKRKNHKARKQADFSTTIADTTLETEMTSTSLVVNTSEINETSTELSDYANYTGMESDFNDDQTGELMQHHIALPSDMEAINT